MSFFFSLVCFEYRRLGGGAFGQRVLFRVASNICYMFCLLLRLDPGVRGEHLTSKLPWIATLLLVTRVYPVYLVDELVLVVRSG